MKNRFVSALKHHSRARGSLKDSAPFKHSRLPFPWKPLLQHLSYSVNKQNILKRNNVGQMGPRVDRSGSLSCTRPLWEGTLLRSPVPVTETLRLKAQGLAEEISLVRSNELPEMVNPQIISVSHPIKTRNCRTYRAFIHLTANKSAVG